MKVLLLFASVCVVIVIKQTNGSVINEKIFQGSTAVKGQFPFQVLLIIKRLNNATGSEGLSFCGGAIISDTFIMTAAHCAYKITEITVYTGITKIDKGNGVIIYNVGPSNVHVHPWYNPDNYRNDIALINIPATIKFTSSIEPINLPEKAWASPKTFDRRNITISGWGQTYGKEEGIHPSLQWAVSRKIPQEECKKHYEGVNRVTDGMICTGNACHGDSGGPCTVRENGTRYVIGVVSWGVGVCGNTKNPVICTNIANYLFWIHGVTGIEID